LNDIRVAIEVIAVSLNAFLRLISPAAYWLSSAAFAASWTTSVDQGEGLPAVSRGGASAVSSAYVFWGKDWVRANQHTKFNVVAPFEYSVAGRNQALKFDFASDSGRSSNQRLVSEFDLEARSSASEVIGGGIAFKFDPATFGSELGEPDLLVGNRTWAWGGAGFSRVKMRFDPPLASAFFERGRKSEVRAFFYNGDVLDGRPRHIATLKVARDLAIDPTPAERYRLDDPTTWPTDILDWKTSPVDLSFLNASEKPAGKHGFLGAVMDRLVFEDGTVARFWGTNLTSYTLFGTSRENVKRQARRLSELGFNLVRLHHHDSLWVNPNIFGDENTPDTQNLNSAMLEKLDWWIKCLKDEGIYVHLDLHVGRQFKAGDGIEGFEEIRKDQSTADLRGFNYVNRSITEAMKRFNEAYVNHWNVYTNTRYKDEPAIVAMLITNENDVTNHFGNRLLGDKNVPKHNALYMAQAEAFAAKHGLPKDRIWRSWEHGPSKLFLNDLEQRFNTEMIAHLRTQGVKVPIIPTSTWGFNPLSSLPGLTAGDIIDAHSYGGTGELEKNPIYTPNFVHWIAAAQVAGKPLSVTEWNLGTFPAPDRHTIPLYLAAAASLQGWDALMQYAYSQIPLNTPGGPSNWDSFNDPGLVSTLPAAALMYRRGHVQEAGATYVFAPSSEQLFNQHISPEDAVALRTAAEISKLVIALPQTRELTWLAKSTIPAGAEVVGDPKQSFINRDATEAVSDSGELRRNWDQGTYTIDTPRTQAAMGRIGGKKINLADVDIAAATRNATVAVQSLDGNPITKSRQILISLGARSVPKSASQLPFYSEPVEGQLTIRAPAGLTLRKKMASSEEGQEIPALYRDGRYLIALDRGLRTYWLILK
jgi:hypothetical protein